MRKQFAVLGAAALLAGVGLTAAPAASAATASQYCGKGYTTSEPQLSYGDTGPAVMALQCQLNEDIANTHLTVDGVFGGLTYNAVVKFQGCTGLKQDGIVGPKTWGQLDGASYLPAESQLNC
ncbi:peptidoglycan-binding protein [Kitasatospora indigofera]|uniref:peptidoglycan-binding domain-containing protein n=1 Tax=Kitasatospora indigofera TaxID=67307 RepID=UPI0036B60BA2